MLFLSFHSQEERRAYNSSAFLELQFCRLPAHMSVKERVTVEHIRHRQNDSLYVADENKDRTNKKRRYNKCMDK